MPDQSARERIVEAARGLFLAQGFSKVTMDELSEELGISKKTLYQNFRSKDDLLDAVIEWQIILLTGKMREVVESSDDFIDKIYSIYMSVGKMICQVSKQFQDDIRKYRPDLWKRVEEVRAKQVLGGFSHMLDEGIRLGLVRDDLNREIVLLMYLSAIQGIINPEVLVRSSFSTEEAFQTILRVYFDGILTETARKLFHSKISLHQSSIIQ